MKAYLNEHGCHEGIINLGGNVLTIGPKKSGEKYHIGIRKPFGEDDLDLITTVEVDDKSVVSSGRYESYFEKYGKIGTGSFHIGAANSLIMRPPS